MHHSTHMHKSQMSISSITSPISEPKKWAYNEYNELYSLCPSNLVKSTSAPPTQFFSSPYPPHYLFSKDNEYLDTLQMRRQRNKEASAKYRHKKNLQQYEMREMINEMSERNKLLQRQMQELQEENKKLRSTTDQLRGQIVAKKLLRQWLDKQDCNARYQVRYTADDTMLDVLSDDDIHDL
ncbi:hypothetical protein BDB01DRAFT_809285 [Pilobolus umbonatus]|nr:hypothetical protein BDB01DRAFT_809285 [Pilobolus umbonatus]